MLRTQKPARVQFLHTISPPADTRTDDHPLVSGRQNRAVPGDFLSTSAFFRHESPLFLPLRCASTHLYRHQSPGHLFPRISTSSSGFLLQFSPVAFHPAVSACRRPFFAQLPFSNSLTEQRRVIRKADFLRLHSRSQRRASPRAAGNA